MNSFAFCHLLLGAFFGILISSFGFEVLNAIPLAFNRSFMEITLQQAQQQVNHWIETTGVRYFNELTNLGVLMEEVGELSRLMVRLYGEQSFKESDKGKDLSDEMADVLWVLLCLANQTGVDLTTALQKNFEKKNIRDAQRHKLNDKLKGS